MAKRIKYSVDPDFNQPGLFDFDRLPTATPKADTPLEQLDFTVNIAEKITPATQPTASDELLPVVVRDTLNFISFGSGSSGNCAYIGDSKSGFLIDAGVDPEHVWDTLRRHCIGPEKVRGICLTHDHSDHVRYVYALVRKNPHIGIYCTPKVLNGMLRRHSLSRRIRDYHRPIYKEFPFNLGNFEITAFEVSHDGSDNAGYFITHGDHTFAIATDLGCITDRVDHYMRQARYIMIESNYDARMLANGPYPIHLRGRIAAPNGHMDNLATAAFLTEIYTPQLTHVFLCHLSKDNNTPETALRVNREALTAMGITVVDRPVVPGADGTERVVRLVALPRYEASPMYSLRID